MRFEGPLYEGDSIIRSLPTAGPVADTEPVKAAPTAEMPQRSTQAKAVDPTQLDAFEIEARARALRAKAIAAWVSAAGAKVVDWLESGRRRQEEAYLARSQDLADLESRLRRLERDGYVPYL